MLRVNFGVEYEPSEQPQGVQFFIFESLKVGVLDKPREGSS